MRVLLVWPILPNSFWSYQTTLDLAGLRSTMPPLGLITVAAMLPNDWELRLIDRNVQFETEADWDWCDMIMVSAMIIQKQDMQDVIRTAVAKGKKVAVGGPFVTSVPSAALEVGAHYLILDEGEITIPMFVEALERGEETGIFRATEKPDVTATPIPRFDLLKMDAYLSMTIQFSRGCPFQCEFCDIITLYGRKPRTKTPEQMLREFDRLYELGWPGLVFVVDDNFIGNKRNAKVFLRALIPWMQERNYPFILTTEASLNLAEDDEMVDLMVQAGFKVVFMGIETPDTDSLKVANKEQNTRGSLVEACHKITRAGIQIMSGFILGFDGERSGAGRRIYEFVEETGIPQAHLGLLAALPNTAMWHRLKQEGRLLEEESSPEAGMELGPQQALMNFVPTRPIEEIATEYIETFWDLYEPELFMNRVYRHISMMNGKPVIDPQTVKQSRPITPILIKALLRVVRLFFIVCWRFGVVRSTRWKFWQQLGIVIREKPNLLGDYMMALAFGEHFFEFRRDVRIKIEQQLAARKAAQAALKTMSEPSSSAFAA